MSTTYSTRLRDCFIRFLLIVLSKGSIQGQKMALNSDIRKKIAKKSVDKERSIYDRIKK